MTNIKCEHSLLADPREVRHMKMVMVLSCEVVRKRELVTMVIIMGRHIVKVIRQWYIRFFMRKMLAMKQSNAMVVVRRISICVNVHQSGNLRSAAQAGVLQCYITLSYVIASQVLSYRVFELKKVWLYLAY